MIRSVRWMCKLARRAITPAQTVWTSSGPHRAARSTKRLLASTGALTPSAPSAGSGCRSVEVERGFLEAVAGGHEPFVTQVVERLARGEVLFGDAWSTRSVAELLDELLEEAADIGAWGVLALQRIDDETPGRHCLMALLEVAASHGALAHESLTLARATVRSS